MRRAAGSAVLLLIVVGACTASRVEPEQDVAVAGTVLRAENSPVSGAGVSLVREGDAGGYARASSPFGLEREPD